MHSTRRRFASLSLMFVVLCLAALTGCAGDATPTQAEASEQTQPTGGSFQPRQGDGVDVVYFEEGNACDCMAEVGDAVEHAVLSNFEQELQSGDLRFFLVVSTDPANESTVDMFNAQPFDLFLVEYVDGAGSATPVYEIWTLMGDNAAIEAFVTATVEGALAEQA